MLHLATGSVKMGGIFLSLSTMFLPDLGFKLKLDLVLFG